MMKLLLRSIAITNLASSRNTMITDTIAQATSVVQLISNYHQTLTHDQLRKFTLRHIGKVLFQQSHSFSIYSPVAQPLFFLQQRLDGQLLINAKATTKCFYRTPLPVAVQKINKTNKNNNSQLFFACNMQFAGHPSLTHHGPRSRSILTTFAKIHDQFKIYVRINRQVHIARKKSFQKKLLGSRLFILFSTFNLTTLSFVII